MPQSIDRVEIFAVGRWRGNRVIEITSSDLDEMVSSFRALSSVVSGYRPIIKLGHSEMQQFFGQKTGAPNLGHISRVWREGDKVLATLANVPDALIDLIRERRYNTVSVEFYPVVEFQGKRYSHVLTAVALLGAELPAVKGLKELADALMNEGGHVNAPSFAGELVAMAQEEETAMPDPTYTQAQVDSLVAAAKTEATKLAEDKANAANTQATTAKDAEIAKFKEDKAKLTEERDNALKAVQMADVKTRKDKITAAVDEAIKSGRALPKDRDNLVALGMAQTGKVKLAAGEVLAEDAWIASLKGPTKQVKLGETGEGSKQQDAEGGAESAGMEVHQKAQALLREKKAKDYAEARAIVLSEDDDLRARYVAGE